MTLKEAIVNRHSVRSYEERPLSQDVVDKLQKLIAECNKSTGLNIQLILNEPKAFNCLLAHYGHFSGVTNYIAIVGDKNADDETIGYYGEKIVLFAQTIGLNTCWVALTYKKIKDAFVVRKGEKLHLVIALGYGKTQGSVRRSKTFDQVSKVSSPPQWFVEGVEAALLAPTAINQQRFTFEFVDGKVQATAGMGPLAKVDLGIVKYHFEVGAGTENFEWA